MSQLPWVLHVQGGHGRQTRWGSCPLPKGPIIWCALPTPTPNIVIMGDFNMPRSVINWQRSEEGNVFPVVASHKEGETAGGKQDRLQAERFMEITSK